jgi:protocatechuate 3,4-dioxygenase beta subunit
MRPGVIIASALGVVVLLVLSMLLLDDPGVDATTGKLLSHETGSGTPALPLTAVDREELAAEVTAALELDVQTSVPFPQTAALAEIDRPHLVGQVVDVDGRPVVGARVGLLPSDGTLEKQRQRHLAERPEEPMPQPRLAAETLTEREGHFRLDTEGLASSPWSTNGEHVTLQLMVTAHRQGTALCTVEWFGDQVTVVPPIALEHELLVRGRVIDAQSAGVAGVTVRPLYWEPLAAMHWAKLEASQRRLLSSLLSTTSDERGFFELTGLVSGAGWLGLWIEGVLPNLSDRLDLSSAVTVADVGDLLLPLGSSIRGSVIDAAGLPISGAKLVASSGPIRWSNDGTIHGEFLWLGNRRLESVVHSASDGSFVLDGLAHPLYRIYAGAAGRNTTLADRVQPGVHDLEIVLSQTAAVTLRVVDIGPERLDEPQLELLARVEGPAPEVAVHVDSVFLFDGSSARRRPVVQRGAQAGEWLVTGIGLEDLWLELEIPGYTSMRGLAKELRTDLSGKRYIELQRECGLDGVVLGGPGGRPVAGAAVSLRRSGSSSATNETTTDEQGRFALRGLSTGAYHIAVRRRGYVPYASSGEPIAEFEAPGDWTETEVKLSPGGDVQGNVQSRAGLPAPGRSVTATLQGQAEDVVMATARADTRGRFSFHDLSLGSIQLSVAHAEPVLVDVRRDHVATALLVLSDDAVVRGRVHKGAFAIAGCVVSLESLRGTTLQSTTSAGDGTYELRTFAKGDMRLLATSESGVQSRTVDVGLAPGVELYADLSLSAASLSGRVVDAMGGFGVEGVAIRAELPVGEVVVLTDARGTFQLDVLPTGPLLLHCEHPDYDSLSAEVSELGVDEHRQQGLLSVHRRLASASLHGTAVHPGGDPAFDGTPIFALPQDAWRMFSRSLRRFRGEEDVDLNEQPSTKTQDGAYLFESLAPGRYTLVQETWTAAPGTGVWSRQVHRLGSIELRSGELHQLDVEVRSP